MVDNGKKKFVWMSDKGMLDQYRIDYANITAKPMSLSNFLVLRTKEKIVMESSLNDTVLRLKHWTKPPGDKFKTLQFFDGEMKAESKELQKEYEAFIETEEWSMQWKKDKQYMETLKNVDEIRRDIDASFLKLDDMLVMTEEKEETFDFPVAFITNILYALEKNGVSNLLRN